MSERLKEPVLKTGDAQASVGSNPTLSATFLFVRQSVVRYLQKYPSGRRGSPAKGVVWVTAARVQIPASPRKKSPASEKMRDFSLYQNAGESFAGTAPPLTFMRIGQLGAEECLSLTTQFFAASGGCWLTEWTFLRMTHSAFSAYKTGPIRCRAGSGQSAGEGRANPAEIRCGYCSSKRLISSARSTSCRN